MGSPQPKRRKKKTSASSDEYIQTEREEDFEEVEPIAGPSHVNSEDVAADASDGSDIAESESKKGTLKAGSSYLKFHENSDWFPLYLYRTMPDLTLAAIRQSGSEGVGRIEIGRTYGVNTKVKAGNRRVSAYIVSSLKSFPDHFGQFQKMEGKFRSIRYFWKVASQPESFLSLFAIWKSVVGSDCPFKIGQVIKFPNTTLSTLRISDVSLRRLTDIMSILKENHVVVTMSKFMKTMTDIEQKAGYKFQVDKKSVLKCLYALEKVHLAHVHETIVVEDNVSNKIHVITEWDIHSPTEERVVAAIRAAIDDFHKQGRVFPHGQLRFSRKKESELSAKYSNDDLSKVNECNGSEMTVDHRLSLFRLQTCRRTAIVSNDFVQHDNDGAPEKNGHLQPEDDSPDEAVLEEMEKEKEAKLGALAKPKSRISFHFDPGVNYGHQSKMIRCYIVHQLAFHFVYGLPEGTTPTVFDRFPPGENRKSEEGTLINNCPMYVDEHEDSPFRFVPPMPTMSGLQRGWFMLHDLLEVVPLSIYVLFVRMKYECEGIEELLRDPILRHTLIGDLPYSLRMVLLREKRALRQLEHLLLLLCGFGLARLAPNPDPKRFPMANTQFFFITRQGAIRDTSTSQRGYACVTPPIEQYKLYEYTFNSNEDVKLYWHHLRAIVQSTPLAFRIDVPTEDDPARMKKYAIGMFDKSQIFKQFEDTSEVASPVAPHDGCAGFDSAFFIHLKRHWDVNPRPSDMVGWFIADWRRSADKVKPLVESRVQRLQKTWNSYVKALMPSEGAVWKRNKVDDITTRSATHGEMAIETKKIRVRNPRVERKLPVKRAKKRKLDSVDLISEQRRLHMRSRFSARERDMLIMIRAVGFFLNPVYRFWLDPTVLRDIMHDYVPESRTKTVQSLMAAGVREMVRPNKISFLQRIVRNLASFREMRRLRIHLAAHPPSSPQAKRDFFIKAFSTASRLIFMEDNSVPPVSSSDAEFDRFLSMGKVTVASEAQQTQLLPLRAQKPTTLTAIRHCVTFNIVMASMLCSDPEEALRAEAMLEQVTASSLSGILEQLRIDGLICKQRLQQDDILLNSKSNATLSYYFRHFFNHRYHSNIVEQTNMACGQVDNGETLTAEDIPGVVIAATKCFYSDKSLELTMPDDLLNVFDATAPEQLANATKQLRYLESADLRLENIVITPSKTNSMEVLPDVKSVIGALKRVIPIKTMGSVLFGDFVLGYPLPERSVLWSVYTAVKETQVVGASIDEVVSSTNLKEEKVNWALRELEMAAQVVLVGVDCPRYVLVTNSNCWLVHSDKFAFFPTPWSTSTGDVYAPTLRWMAEGVLFGIVSRPGQKLKDLISRFAFALQPRMLLDIVSMLVSCGCVTVVRTNAAPFKVSDPFSLDTNEEIVEHVSATACAVERFSRIFHTVKLSETLTQKGLEAD